MQPASENQPRRRRTEALRIRISQTERDAINAAAKAEGVGPCTFARIVVVAAAGQKPTPAPRARPTPSQSSRDVANAISEITKISNKLNQLARAANSDLDRAIIAEATAELQRLRESIVASHDKRTLS